MTEGSSSTATRVVDSHIHFWDTELLDYPWLRAHPGLDRPFLPAHLDVGDVEVEALLFVQANPVWEQVDDETSWVIGLAGDEPRITAIVAGAPLDRGPAAVAGHLQRLGRTSGVVGVRQLIEGEPAGFAVAPDFVDAVRLAGAQGLVVDLCIHRQQLAEVTRLVEQCPEVAFVLDHLGKPDIAGGELTNWAADLGRLARLDNVSCKPLRVDGRDGRTDQRRRDRRHVPADGPGRLRAEAMHVRQRLAERGPARLLPRMGRHGARRDGGPEPGRAGPSHARHSTFRLSPCLGPRAHAPGPRTADRRVPAPWHASPVLRPTTSGSPPRATSTARTR